MSVTSQTIEVSLSQFDFLNDPTTFIIPDVVVTDDDIVDPNDPEAKYFLEDARIRKQCLDEFTRERSGLYCPDLCCPECSYYRDDITKLCSGCYEQFIVMCNERKREKG